MSAISKLNAVRTKIAALTLLLPALEAAASREVDPALLVPGATVNFEFGRGDKKRVYEGGVIVAVKAPDPEVKTSYTQLKIEHGAGFDANFFVTPVSGVVRIVKDAEGNEVAAPVVEESAAEQAADAELGGQA